MLLNIVTRIGGWTWWSLFTVSRLGINLTLFRRQIADSPELLHLSENADRPETDKRGSPDRWPTTPQTATTGSVMSSV
jgi:hypothetical protein